MDDGPFDGIEPGGVTPTEAFSILGNETRVAILQALWESEGPMSFSELRNAVGVDKGNFNYHLGELSHFVRQRDETYELREAGKQVLRAVIAGAITEAPSFGPTRIDHRCPYCGGPVELSYEEEAFTARCTRCVGAVRGETYPRGTFLRYALPPASLEDRTPEEVLAVAHRLYDGKITAMIEGVCSECAGVVGFSVDACPDHDASGRELCATCGTRHSVWVEACCENCRYARQFVLWFAVVINPAVVAFYHDHGAPWNRVPFAKLTRENARYVSDISEEVLSREPFRARVAIQLGDDEIHVTVDDDLEVIDATRDDA